MGHKNTGGSLHQQVQSALQKKAAFGQSKHTDKQEGTTAEKVYSINTMKSYMKAGNAFASWAKGSPGIKADLGHRPRTLEECRPYIKEWVQEQQTRGLSAYTINLRISALSKLYGDKLEDVERPSVAAQDISRSRVTTTRDSHFSKARNAALINVCQCVGFRRSELEHCKAEDLRIKDGSYAVEIKGKGGRIRVSPITGSPEQVAAAVEWIRNSTGHNSVPGAMDVHSYRAEYATRVYNQHARDIDAIKGSRIDYTLITGKAKEDGSHIYKSAVLYGRGSRAGVVYDRCALIKASQALGHNRESVVVKHYLYSMG